MLSQESVETYCPYCGEHIQLLVDCSISEQEYIEDCQVCCRPIHVQAQVNSEGMADVIVRSEIE